MSPDPSQPEGEGSQEPIQDLKAVRIIAQPRGAGAIQPIQTSGHEAGHAHDYACLRDDGSPAQAGLVRGCRQRRRRGHGAATATATVTPRPAFRPGRDGRRRPGGAGWVGSHPSPNDSETVVDDGEVFEAVESAEADQARRQLTSCYYTAYGRGYTTYYRTAYSQYAYTYTYAYGCGKGNTCYGYSTAYGTSSYVYSYTASYQYSYQTSYTCTPIPTATPTSQYNRNAWSSPHEHQSSQAVRDDFRWLYPKSVHNTEENVYEKLKSTEFLREGNVLEGDIFCNGRGFDATVLLYKTKSLSMVCNHRETNEMR